MLKKVTKIVSAASHWNNFEPIKTVPDTQPFNKPVPPAPHLNPIVRMQSEPSVKPNPDHNATEQAFPGPSIPQKEPQAHRGPQPQIREVNSVRYLPSRLEIGNPSVDNLMHRQSAQVRVCEDVDSPWQPHCPICRRSMWDCEGSMGARIRQTISCSR